MKKIIKKIVASEKLKKITSLLRKNRRIILVFLTLFIFIDIFVLEKSSDLLFFSILFLYGVIIKISQIKSKQTFLLCITILIAMLLNYIFVGVSVQSEKSAVWFFLFMTLGIFQEWRE